ncbi:MAG: hypothetical protein GY841_11350 [FCB group bacterium]|nr:hypothetical protein [FCB group bacterium]
MRRLVLTAVAGMILVLVSLAFAHSSLEGYSGAPGTNGTCAANCHGSPGGTIQVTGFPAEYEPGQTYTINITHDGGDLIRQFNASCRVGAGSENAGMIAAGTNTETYNNLKESNGVHFSSDNHSLGSFDWTAPALGTGEVRLYLAGLQGGYNGLNSAMILTSAEQAQACGDTNCDGSINIGDAVYLINYIFKSGPAPCSACQ